MWSSFNLYQTAYAGLGAACFIGGAWIVQQLLFGEEKKRKKDMPPGLVNLGSTTCYCNTVLQCMAPLNCLHLWLQEFSERRKFSGDLHLEMYRTLQVLSNHCEPDVLLISSEHLLSLLQGLSKFQYFTQQDCHEFFQLLCEKLQTTGAGVGKTSLTLFSEVSSISNENQTVLPKFPLCGRLATRLRCLSCGTAFPLSVEPFVSLSVSVTAPISRQNPYYSRGPYGMLTLNDLLAAFISDELLSDAICEKCQSKNCLQKQSKIISAPQVICIHILRSTWFNQSSTKRGELVSFPESIDLTQFMQYKPADAASKLLYSLRSVIVHYGSASSSGHFAAYRQTPSGRRWCYASDEDVSFVDKETVLSSEPYMLFYEKV